MEALLLPLARVGMCNCVANVTSSNFYMFGFRWVYTLVQRHIRRLEGIPAEFDESAAEANEEFDEEASLLPSRSV